MALDPTSSDPLYQQVTDRLRAAIASGALAPGERIGTHRTLAERYGVSVITVKRALADLADEGLVYSRVGQGTFVTRERAVERTARAQPSRNILGIVLQDLKSPFFSMIVQSIEEGAYEAGYSVMLSTAGDQMSKETRQIEHFQDIGVDGLIIASMQPQNLLTPTVREVHDAGFPYVMVSYVDDEDIFFVGSDHEQGAYMATSHLLQGGYERVGYLSAEQNNRLSRVRERGYRRAVEEQGLGADDRWIYHASDEGEWNYYTSGYRVGQQMVAARERPQAIFAYSDLLAIGFMQAVLDAGLRVPEDIAIVGFDDIHRSRYAPVPLTTVRQPVEEIGRRAVDILLAQIRGEAPPRRTGLRPELVVRASCVGSALSDVAIPPLAG